MKFIASSNGVLTDVIVTKAREEVKEATHDAILGILDAVHDFLSQTEYSVFLIGTGILVVLRSCGFKHPWIRPGVMMVLHVFLRFLLGGLAV